MARYELILKQDGALWLRIILKRLLTPKGAIQDPQNPKKRLKVRAKPAKTLLLLKSSDRKLLGDKAVGSMRLDILDTCDASVVSAA